MSGVGRPAHPSQGSIQPGQVTSRGLQQSIHPNPHPPSIHESIYAPMIQILSLRSARVRLEVVTGQRTWESMHCLAAVQQ
jgi:hypothetical protein